MLWSSAVSTSAVLFSHSFLWNCKTPPRKKKWFSRFFLKKKIGKSFFLKWSYLNYILFYKNRDFKTHTHLFSSAWSRGDGKSMCVHNCMGVQFLWSIDETNQRSPFPSRAHGWNLHYIIEPKVKIMTQALVTKTSRDWRLWTRGMSHKRKAITWMVPSNTEQYTARTATWGGPLDYRSVTEDGAPVCGTLADFRVTTRDIFHYC